MWGAASGRGWASLPAGIIHMPDGDARHPICMADLLSSQRAAAGWLGIATTRIVDGKVRLQCSIHGGANASSAKVSDGGTIFKQASGRPAPVWLGTNATSPEPWGAVKLLTQETSRRPIYACGFPLEGRAALGYIGDDGKCYGATREGKHGAGSSYQVLVTDATAGSRAPRYGWVPGGPGFVPHGTLAQAIQPNIPSQGAAIIRVDPVKRTVCRAQESGTWWPGYLSPFGGCDYFTYFNNTTQRKNTSTFEVFRMGPGDNMPDYVFGAYGGMSFRSCVAYKSNIPDDTVWGFSSNTTGCTDGVHTSSSGVNPLDLPRVNADRG
jgi:hypothetical protein